MSRTLVWFSCGANSAIAAKIAVEELENVEILYCDTLAYEHPDNLRFLENISTWLNRPIKFLRSEKYKDIFDVFERKKYLNGINGAPCTVELKKVVRKSYQLPDDVHVFGYSADEQNRVERFKAQHPDLKLRFLLVEKGLTKQDCFRELMKTKIEIPVMYRMGYKNNNCIGCVKGGAGYWNKIRVDFPETFKRMSAMERKLNHALLRVKGKPCFLDKLPSHIGNYKAEFDIDCGPQCVTEEVRE